MKRRYGKRKGRAGRIRRKFHTVRGRRRTARKRGGMRAPRPGKIGYRL